MLMAAVAYNLKKLMRWEGKKANTVVKALQRPLENAFFNHNSYPYTLLLFAGCNGKG